MCDATSLQQALLLFKHCPEHTEDKLNAVVYMNLKVKTQNFFYCLYIFSLKHVLCIADFVILGTFSDMLEGGNGASFQ